MFITTKENPIFKEGLKISEKMHSTFSPYYSKKYNEVLLSSKDEVKFLKKGWIEPVEKPEFTKSDMIDMIKFDFNSVKLGPDEVFEDWIKNRAK